MALTLGWGMSCGTENISGPTEVRETPQTPGMSPAVLHQGWGLSPQWEPAQRDLVAFYKGPAKSSQCRFQLELGLEQTQALTFPESANVSLRAQFWGWCGNDSPVWALDFLQCSYNKEYCSVGILRETIPNQLVIWAVLSETAPSRRLLVINSNSCWALPQVVVLAPSAQKKRFISLLKEQPFISSVLLLVVSWHRNPLIFISAAWFAL